MKQNKILLHALAGCVGLLVALTGDLLDSQFLWIFGMVGAVVYAVRLGNSLYEDIKEKARAKAIRAMPPLRR